MTQTQSWKSIPTHLTLEQFETFVLPYLHIGSRGPQPKLSLHAIFNYILKFLYLGCQWKELPIEKDKKGQPEIHSDVLKLMGVLKTFLGRQSLCFTKKGI